MHIVFFNGTATNEIYTYCNTLCLPDALPIFRSRDGALEHVEVRESGSGSGVWVSDRGAELNGLAVGDTALVGRSELPVAGIYRDLAGTSVDDYWCSNADLVLLEQRGGDLVAPPPIVLVDPESLALVMRGATVAIAQGAWEAPLRSGITEIGRAHV